MICDFIWNILIALLTMTLLDIFFYWKILCKIFYVTFIIKSLFHDENRIEMHVVSTGCNVCIGMNFNELWVKRRVSKILMPSWKDLKLFSWFNNFLVRKNKLDFFIHLSYTKHNLYWIAKCLHCLEIIVTNPSIIHWILNQWIIWRKLIKVPQSDDV